MVILSCVYLRRGEDIFSIEDSSLAQSVTYSECGYNEFATGVTTWTDTDGNIAAIRLECAEFVPASCVPPHLDGENVESELETTDSCSNTHFTKTAARR